ncbi:MAG: hypothetical protein WCQ53_07455 [bacterium]
MKKLIPILVIVAVLLSAYFIIKQGRRPVRNPRTFGMMEQQDATGTSQENQSANSAAANAQSANPSKDERNKKPEEAFSDSKTGQRIVKLLELMKYLDNPTSEKGKKGWDYIQKLRETPTETFNEIKQGTDLLSPENETKRQYLIQFANTLDVPKEDKLDFLGKELSSSAIYAKGKDNVQVLLTPSIVFETYLKTSGNDESAEKFLTDVLPNTSVEVQKTLLSAYNKVNPKKADELIKQYGLKTN